MENIIWLSIKVAIQCVLALLVLDICNVTDQQVSAIFVAAVAIGCVYRHVAKQKELSFQPLRTE